MTHIKRNSGMRTLSLLLAVVMFCSLFAISAQAESGATVLANMEDVQHYDHYVCIGDSIAAGYGPYARKVRGFVTVPQAYHGLVASATGAEFQSLAHVGMRTVEARWLLDDDYSASPEAASLEAMYFNGMSDYLFWMDQRTSAADPGPYEKYQVSEAIRNELKDYYGAFGLKNFYRDNIAKSDLITVGLGLNDVFLYAMKMTARELDNPNMNLILEVEEYLRYMAIGYNAFLQNWAPLINAIKSINPDITIVVVGMYNPFKEVRLTGSSWAKVGQAADVVVAAMNNYLQQQAETLGYKYADVMQTEICDTVPFTDETFFDKIVADCHPTEAGHFYMMEQILDQLPSRNDLPFTDVPKDAWYYDNVAYCWKNGLMQGVSAHEFHPDEATTRAQVATVLYRMAGTPSVAGMSCPFQDVPHNSYYENAVIWGYNTGVIKGTSATTFEPDANITREQMVTLLFRYSGESAPSGSLSQFGDAASISDFARPAVIWAVQNGIVSGTGDGNFTPQGTATRGQLAKVLHMYQTR